VYFKGAILSSLIFCISLTAFAHNAPPVECNQIALWVGSDVPSASLQRFVQKRGVAFSLDESEKKALVDAGADASLLHLLGAMVPPPPGEEQACSAEIKGISAQLHARNY
jgi:hypothetical protein